MAKKGFINTENPAMQFISTAAPEAETSVPEAAAAPAESVIAAKEVKTVSSQQEIKDIYLYLQDRASIKASVFSC